MKDIDIGEVIFGIAAAQARKYQLKFAQERLESVLNKIDVALLLQECRSEFLRQLHVDLTYALQQVKAAQGQ